jgi:hypothetical protein
VKKEIAKYYKKETILKDKEIESDKKVKLQHDNNEVFHI